MATNNIIETVRQQEYTGKNRCIPCTAVNVAIAAVVSIVVGLASPPLGAATFALFVGVIYLRGYLVPGTPAFTKRYFPDRVLAWFDKEPISTNAIDTDEENLDVETVLYDAGALKVDSDSDDLILAPDFREDWHKEIDRFDETTAKQTLASMLGIAESRVTLEDRQRSYAVTVGDSLAGTWESRAAFVAEMAADRVLAKWINNWTEVSVDSRSGVLRGVRVYLDWCPRCGGTVTMSEETTESCCRSRDVFVSTCENCGVRLFEINAMEVENAEV